MAQPPDQFPVTQWSLIATAREGTEAESAAALNALCRAYWQPLYAFARRRGAGPDEVPDFVQGFLSDFIGRGDLIRSTPERGRFRSFLLTSFQNYLVSQKRRQMAEKRGGRMHFIALEDLEREEKWQATVADAAPERAYDLRWAQQTMRRALDRVAEDYRRVGSEAMFEALRPVLFGEKTAGAEELAHRFGITAGGVGAAVFRLRAKFRAVLRDEVSQTVAAPEELDGEILYLLTLLAQ